MPAQRYYIRYLEGRDRLRVHSGPTLIVEKSFDAGLHLSERNGYQRKRDAVRNVDEINAAAGKVIAEYAGAFVPTSRW